MKKKEIKIIIIALIVTAIIVSTGFLVFFDTSEEKEKSNDKITVIDDRISPLTNQGLILEIQRIRHRGLLEEITKMGAGWKEKPEFYFISNIDGTEYVSKDVSAAGAESEILFNTWDTLLQENKIMEDTKDGQSVSNVKLSFVERESSGLFGRDSEDIVKDEIEVTYDYRTGRWTGDDYFMDDDGHGHYLGDTFEIWFDIYQTGADSDGIPYWVEVNVLGTDPMVDDSKLDPDDDGIPTSWEWKWGYDPFSWDDHSRLDPDLDGIENIEEYKMSKYFSNPFQRDIYIEVDGMESTGLFDPAHVFYEESSQILCERFAQHGINVYIDNGWPDGPKNGGGELVPHVETISQDSGMILQFYRHHFADERKGIFRYMLVGHNTGFCHPSVSNKYDTIAIDSSLNKLIRRQAFTGRSKRIVLATAAMHELGHSQGLGSWTFAGIDNRTIYSDKKAFLEKWDVYESVMNYNYIFDKNLLDYSSGENGAPYDQDDWSKLYLPTFQMDAEVIEGPNYVDLVDFNQKASAVVDKISTPALEGWKYDKNLTDRFVDTLSDENIIYRGECEYFVLKKSDDNANTIPGSRNIRVYVKPNTEPVYSAWSLSREGVFKSKENSFEFYSVREIVDSLNTSNQ
jgi:hypothetical protein